MHMTMMSARGEEISISGLSADSTALFFDFDGVLVDIAEDPGAVVLIPDVRKNLDTMNRATNGAVAVISGRSIEQLDQFLSPLLLSAAGVHGAERRRGNGAMTRASTDGELHAKVRGEVEHFVEQYPGTLCEDKGASIALHYRNRPELESVCGDFADEVASSYRKISVMAGKMVFELKLAEKTKGDAIREFMAEPPFQMRLPVFVGDDVTDEDGFRAVNEMGGVSVKVGDGETAARVRMHDAQEFRYWLSHMASRWGESAMQERSRAR